MNENVEVLQGVATEIRAEAARLDGLAVTLEIPDLQQDARRMNRWAESVDAAIAALVVQATGGDTMTGRMLEADFMSDTITFQMTGKYHAAAGEYIIAPAPLPTPPRTA